MEFENGFYIMLFFGCFLALYLIHSIQNLSLEVKQLREDSSKQNAVSQHLIHALLSGERPNLAITSIHELELQERLTEGNLSLGECLELAKSRARNELTDLTDPMESNDLKPDPTNKV